ncbi:SurA N-terminal domain-containing protein [Modicisalibacter luteus]|uniref:Periplasmic chaperone PpiD n=1 Tax=Modicisalibacter luteus TaxID=453962 RepID=A0ABV7M4A5_9GAMM|nr:SurA N-terminal domain-containing protein [Halomonas lutea]GHA84129.1 peptidylprolyl isomerase [Halomonas lutea]
MLQQIRDRSQSMIAKVIVGAVIVALALFGIESVIGLFTSGSDNVAEVNGEPVTRQQVEIEVQRAIRSGQVPPEQERALRNQVIEQLVSREVLDQYAEEGGLYASEAQIDHLIVNLAEFQDQNGKFSKEIFRNRLASAGYTPLAFRQQLREDLIRQQVQQGLTTSEFVLDSERERFVELQRQTRSFRYHVLARDDLERDVTVSDEELQSYYQANQDQYRRPEQVRLAYVILDQADLADSIQVDEQALRDAYAEREREAGRRVSHIMVSFGDERTREEARARLQKVKDRLAAGDDFAELAAEYSDDGSTADSQGDLGFINRGFFGESFENAAFSLKPGQVSDIVETENGLHLIKVTDLDIPPFEEMRDTLRQDVAMEKAGNAFNERAQRLIDESFAADDLASVADDLGLPLQQSDWVSRDGASGVLAEPGVMAAAFETDVLENGYNSEVIELDDQRRMVLRVTDHREATTLPLDEVREQVRSAVEQEKVKETLRERASEMAQALRNGDSLNLDWQQVDNVSRQQEVDVPQPILQQAFRLPRPEGSDPVYGQTAIPQGVALIALTSVEAGDASAEDQTDAFIVQMAERLRAQAAVQGLLETLKDEAEVERL